MREPSRPDRVSAAIDALSFADCHEGGVAAHTAVDKAFELLKAFPGGGLTVGVSELARKNGLPKSTVFRLLAAMERQGIVDRYGSRYRLGHELYDLGGQVYEIQPGVLLDVLAPAMTTLYQRSRATVHLGVLHGEEVVLVGRMHGPQPTPPGLLIGSRFPAHSSALGKAMLAHCPDETEKLLARPLQYRTPHTIVERVAFRRELEHTRRRGLAISQQEARPDVNCVAIALLNEENRPAAALAVSTSSHEFDGQRLGLLLRRAAVDAQRLLRHTIAVSSPAPRSQDGRAPGDLQKTDGDAGAVPDRCLTQQNRSRGPHVPHDGTEVETGSDEHR